MSIQIPCPHCGVRPIEEFLHGEITRTPEEVADADQRDLHRVFFHDNSEGEVAERWFHVFGCRRWLTLCRDSRDDRVLPPVSAS